MRAVLQAEPTAHEITGKARDLRKRFQRGGQPAISVDTKKKELVGDFKNVGREWRPKGKPEAVWVHDFVIPEQGKAIPYGVYDLQRNEGWVSVGIDHDTASLAVNAIRRWWKQMGRHAYAGANSLLEHRLFSHIAMNWRGKPLVSLAVIVSLIGSTTTGRGCESGPRSTTQLTRREPSSPTSRWPRSTSNATPSMGIGTTRSGLVKSRPNDALFP